MCFPEDIHEDVHLQIKQKKQNVYLHTTKLTMTVDSLNVTWLHHNIFKFPKLLHHFKKSFLYITKWYFIIV